MNITIYYRSVDGFRQTRRFKTLTGARRYATDCVGNGPEFGIGYAVSPDGVGTLRCTGTTLRELFARPRQTIPSAMDADWQAERQHDEYIRAGGPMLTDPDDNFPF